MLDKYMQGWWSCLNSVAEDVHTVREAIRGASLTKMELQDYLKSNEYKCEMVKRVVEDEVRYM